MARRRPSDASDRRQHQHPRIRKSSSHQSPASPGNGVPSPAHDTRHDRPSPSPPARRQPRPEQQKAESFERPAPAAPPRRGPDESGPGSLTFGGHWAPALHRNKGHSIAGPSTAGLARAPRDLTSRARARREQEKGKSARARITPLPNTGYMPSKSKALRMTAWSQHRHTRCSRGSGVGSRPRGISSRPSRRPISARLSPSL
jgi:hypothetical protein